MDTRRDWFTPFVRISLLSSLLSIFVASGASHQLIALEPSKGGLTNANRLTAIIVQSAGKTHAGRYSNANYGYSVLIPKGLVGTSDSPPAPQHGIRISLSKNPPAFIWIDGSYNADEYSSADQAVEADLALLKKGGAEVLESQTEAAPGRAVSDAIAGSI